MKGNSTVRDLLQVTSLLSFSVIESTRLKRSMSLKQTITANGTYFVRYSKKKQETDLLGRVLAY